MLLGLVGVSGIGKTYFKEKIVEKLNFNKVNTIRTRPIRSEEKNGQVGFFVTEEELQKLKHEGKTIYDFKVFSATYAYLKEEILSEKNMVFEMHYTMINDWKEIRPDIKTIYIMPTDIEIPKIKIKERNLSYEKEQERIKELEEHYDRICKDEELRKMFDYIVYNNYDIESENRIIKIVEEMLEKV